MKNNMKNNAEYKEFNTVYINCIIYILGKNASHHPPKVSGLGKYAHAGSWRYRGILSCGRGMHTRERREKGTYARLSFRVRESAHSFAARTVRDTCKNISLPRSLTTVFPNYT